MKTWERGVCSLQFTTAVAFASHTSGAVVFWVGVEFIETGSSVDCLDSDQTTALPYEKSPSCQWSCRLVKRITGHGWGLMGNNLTHLARSTWQRRERWQLLTQPLRFKISKNQLSGIHFVANALEATLIFCMKPENSRDFCVARLHQVYRDLKRPTFNSHTNIDFLVVCKRLTIGIQRTQVWQQMLYKTSTIAWYRASYCIHSWWKVRFSLTSLMLTLYK